MQLALKQAEKARKKNEVPVGAVIELDGKVISTGYNKRETKQNAIAHAEILAIQKACKKLKSWRLDGCKIFVTLEPCVMCVGAIMNARISELVYGASDNKQGAAGGALSLAQKNLVSHNLKVEAGVMKEGCEKIIKDFFKAKRSVKTVDKTVNKE